MLWPTLHGSSLSCLDFRIPPLPSKLNLMVTKSFPNSRYRPTTPKSADIVSKCPSTNAFHPEIAKSTYALLCLQRPLTMAFHHQSKHPLILLNSSPSGAPKVQVALPTMKMIPLWTIDQIKVQPLLDNSTREKLSTTHQRGRFPSLAKLWKLRCGDGRLVARRPVHADQCTLSSTESYSTHPRRWSISTARTTSTTFPLRTNLLRDWSRDLAKTSGRLRSVSAQHYIGICVTVATSSIGKSAIKQWNWDRVFLLRWT